MILSLLFSSVLLKYLWKRFYKIEDFYFALQITLVPLYIPHLFFLFWGNTQEQVGCCLTHRLFTMNKCCVILGFLTHILKKSWFSAFFRLLPLCSRLAQLREANIKDRPPQNVRSQKSFEGIASFWKWPLFGVHEHRNGAAL